MWASLREKLSVEFIKMQIMRTAYGNRGTFVARLDPRILLVWYLVFALIPWFFYNRTILFGLCAIIAVVAALGRVSGFLIFMLAFGIVSDVIGWAIAGLFFGGDLTLFAPLSTLILKLLAVSLASIAIFSTVEPDRIADALLSFGMPDQFAFGLSYGYRMIPTLFEEYQRIIHAYRLRSHQPDKVGFLGLRWVGYWAKLIIRAFYPMILNTALRTRTTVESLEIRGYTYALEHPKAKRLKLQYLKVTTKDILFLALTLLGIAAAVLIGLRFPL